MTEFNYMKSRFITFNNGSTASVQCGEVYYSVPRRNEGPYTHVEVGFPSEGSAIPEKMLEYAEDSEEPHNTVYAYMPSEILIEFVEANGGIKHGELPPIKEQK